MIPKKIHYCWLNGSELPDKIKRYVQTWKDIMPDYELVLWDENKFDVNSVPFVKEAIAAKKWAFASDYIRLYAVYTEGGIYMDTDVFVQKKFDDFLSDDFFSAVEYFSMYIQNKNKVYVYEDGSVIQYIQGITMLSAVFGAVSGHPFLKDCMDWYKNKHFSPTKYNALSPDVLATIAQRYGFRYKNEEQNLSQNMKIYPSQIIASNVWDFSKDAHAIHCCEGSWLNIPFLIKITRKNNFLRKLFKKPPIIKDLYSYVKSKL